VAALALALTLSACGRNMYDTPRAEALERSPFFADGAASQAPPEDTLSRERGAVDPAFFTGQGEGGLASELPVELSVELLLRGQERYNIFCTPCHGYDGRGDGVVVQKGFVQPTSFHAQRLLDQPVGYYVNAITNGFGRMYSYASRIPPEDRWAIAGYIKALQLSQNATVDDVPADVLEELRAAEGRVR
jgi:mono/diheme cytochrome c family protein